MERELDPQATDRLRAAGEAVRDALMGVLATMPKRERTAEGVTRRFGLEGVVARRVVRASACGDGLVALTRLPAAKHLHRLADAVEDRRVAERLHESVRAYGALMGELGVGPVALKRIVRSGGEADGE